jgi:hypothetical protein
MSKPVPIKHPEDTTKPLWKEDGNVWEAEITDFGNDKQVRGYKLEWVIHVAPRDLESLVNKLKREGGADCKSSGNGQDDPIKQIKP